MPSCQPAASVIVTTIGMITTIFGISRVVISIRAGTDSRPRIGPMISPMNRSTIVHDAPPTTWKKSIGHFLFAAIAITSRTTTSAAATMPVRGTIRNSGISMGGWGGAASAPAAGSDRVTSTMCGGDHTAPRGGSPDAPACLSHYLAAEGAGFEPAVRVNGLQFSRLAHSTALPPLRVAADDASRRIRGPTPSLYTGRNSSGEVAEWLKALAC